MQTPLRKAHTSVLLSLLHIDGLNFDAGAAYVAPNTAVGIPANYLGSRQINLTPILPII
jgi:hypothetical protein